MPFLTLPILQPSSDGSRYLTLSSLVLLTYNFQNVYKHFIMKKRIQNIKREFYWIWTFSHATSEKEKNDSPTFFKKKISGGNTKPTFVIKYFFLDGSVCNTDGRQGHAILNFRHI